MDHQNTTPPIKPALQTTQPIPSTPDTPSPIAPISPEVPHKKSVAMPLAIILGVLILAVGGYTYSSTFMNQNTVTPPVTDETPISSPATSTTTPVISEPQSNSSLSTLEYVTPQGWVEEKVTLAEDETLRRHPYQLKYTSSDGIEEEKTTYVVDIVGSSSSNEPVILFSKSNDWYLTVQSKPISENGCGGESMLADEYNPTMYKELTVLGQTVVRPNLEQGFIRIMPEYYGDARSQIIQSKKEATSNGYQTVELPFCVENIEKGISLKIQYHSPYFIRSNFDSKNKTSKNIDVQTLSEMDSIVESIK